METSTDELPYHVPTAFKVGDRVRLVRQVKAAHAWYNEAEVDLSQLIGQVKQVKQADPMAGFLIGDKSGVAWVPSPALELVGPESSTVIEVPAPTSTPVQVKPATAARAPKTRTTKAGPWDMAPCPHLKWHMMGFFKEQLKLSVTKVKTDAGQDLGEGLTGEAELTFCCSKCTKTIVMTAPIKVTK